MKGRHQNTKKMYKIVNDIEENKRRLIAHFLAVQELRNL